MSRYRYRVYDKENEKKVYLFPTYFCNKKKAIEYAKQVPNAVVQKKCGYVWYTI